jgi:hypothetical protein
MPYEPEVRNFFHFQREKSPLELAIGKIPLGDVLIRADVHSPTPGVIHFNFERQMSSAKISKEIRLFSDSLLSALFHGEAHPWAIDNPNNTPHYVDLYSRYLDRRLAGIKKHLESLKGMRVFGSVLIGKGAARVLVLEFGKNFRKPEKRFVISLHPEANESAKKIHEGLRGVEPAIPVHMFEPKSYPRLK